MGGGASAYRGGKTGDAPKNNRSRAKTVLSKLKPSQEKETSPTLTMMMLGMGGVGKTTVHKQVTRTFGDGATADQIDAAIHAVRTVFVKKTLAVSNLIVEGTQEAAGRLSGPPIETQNEGNMDTMLEKVDEITDILASVDTRAKKNTSHSRFMDNELDALSALLSEIWNTEIFRDAMSKYHSEDLEAEMEFSMVDRFADQLQRVFSQQFSLSSEDFLAVRQPTRGICKSLGSVSGSNFTLMDVGGQELFQEEWNQMLSASKMDMQKKPVVGILYIASLDDYRHKCKKKGNRLSASLSNWKKLQSNSLIIDPDPVPIIVLLNKVDLFRKYLHKHKEDFHEAFENTKERGTKESRSEYENRCISVVQKKFEEYYAHGKHGQKLKVPLQSYVTCAMDTTMVKSIFEKYVEVVITQSMQLSFNC